MNRQRFFSLFAAVLGICSACIARADSLPLSALGVSKIQQDWGAPRVNLSVSSKPLSIGGASFTSGIGTHAESTMWIDLHGSAVRLTAKVGMDDEVSSDPRSANAAVEFEIIADGDRTLFDSGAMKVGDAAKPVNVDLAGVHALLLLVEPVGNGIGFCHADWAEAQIEYNGEKPAEIAGPTEKAEILTPPAPASPRINGAGIFGVRPMRPILYTIAATGSRPMNFSAENLPPGVALDGAAGRLSGSIAAAGEYVVRLKATNALGSAMRDLKIEVGDRIALTPQMGWNSWNCFAGAVSDKKIRAAADAMVNSGLIDHGWNYINIDDCWQVRSNAPADQRRAPDGHILSNHRFPDMAALADYIHSKGLRAGLYSTPGPSTCGGYTGSYGYEQADARQYAQWGFDYLKYDWCSYADIAKKIQLGPNPPSELEILQHPYLVMSQALHAQDRDILFSLCQYGMGDSWEWGEQVGGNSWRTTDDIRDTWSSMAGIGFSQNGHEKYAGPGHWNDPDMLVVGKVGWGPSLHPTRLTPNEQYTHISLWSLLSAPLLIGCDMTQMDPFTLSLLSNDEVLAVNQDALGRQASRVAQPGPGLEIWAKDLSDGSKAVGLFNRKQTRAAITVKWSDLGLTGPQQVRDLWRQQDLPSDPNGFTAQVERHGVALIKVSRVR